MGTSVETLSPEQAENLMRRELAARGSPVNRISRYLSTQLAHMPHFGGLNHPSFWVNLEILHLEGLGETQTKPEALFFDDSKFVGFWHKHFFVPHPQYGHLQKNFGNAWQFARSKSKKFVQMSLRLARPFKTEADSNTLEEKLKFSQNIAHESIHGKDGLVERLRRKETTGDWLIFIKHEGSKYYLCIAGHDDYEGVWRGLWASISDFPFLEAILRSR